MRVIKYFVQYTLFIAGFLILSGALFREGVLFHSTDQLRRAISRMDSLSRRLDDFDTQCQTLGGPGVRAEDIQLRFTDSNTFAIEIICQFFPNQPVEVETLSFLPYANKISGKSGFIWDPSTITNIGIEVLQRKSTVLLDGDRVKISQGYEELEGSMPATSCVGFGYMCCDLVTYTGEGSQLSGNQILDCSDNCFETCAPRPTVLQFSSDPTPDLTTQILTISRDTEVTFYYNVDLGKNRPVDTILDFGDGNVQSLEGGDGTAPHIYTCAQATCTYTATLTMTDSKGIQSAVTNISTLTVLVQ